MAPARLHLLVKSVPGGWFVSDLGDGLRKLGSPTGGIEVVMLRADGAGGSGSGKGSQFPISPPTVALRCPYLRVKNGPAGGFRYEIPPGQQLRLGRATECEIAVDDACVSRIHAVVANLDGAVFLADAGSMNGSFVDGRRVHEPVQLADGVEIRLGKIRLGFQLPGG